MSALPLIPFNKPPLNLPDQLGRLISRGLNVPDRATAAQYLSHIGYSSSPRGEVAMGATLRVGAERAAMVRDQRRVVVVDPVAAGRAARAPNRPAGQGACRCGSGPCSADKRNYRAYTGTDPFTTPWHRAALIE